MMQRLQPIRLLGAMEFFSCPALILLLSAVWSLVAFEAVQGQTTIARATTGQPPILVRPSDATVQAGSTVVFQCAPAAPSDSVTWTYINSTGGVVVSKKLFVVINSHVIYLGQYGAKYTANDTYSLVVWNVTVADGGTYMCNSSTTTTIPATTQAVTANLVVIGSISPSLSTPAGKSLVVGQSVTVTCALTYGAPNSTQYPLAAGQSPQLAAWVGSTNLQATQYISAINTITAVAVDTTVQSSYVGQDVVCQVVSKVAFIPLRFYADLVLPIPYAPNYIAINTTTSLVYTDRVNCSAHGYPVPTVNWVSFNPNAVNPQSANYGPGWALLGFTNAQVATWTCVVFNGLSPRILQNYTFIVTNSPGQVSVVVGSASKSGALGVSAILGLVLFHQLLLNNF